MGGANGGQVASSTAIRVFASSVKSSLSDKKIEDLTEQEIEDILNQAANDANAEVYLRASEDSDLDGMGTTLVAVLLCRSGAYVLNIGDSRLYMLTRGTIRQITKDHSFIQYLLDKGLITPEEAVHHPNKNIILRAIGVNEDLVPDLFHLQNNEFEQLLLCSDGLYNMLSDEELCGLANGTYAGKKNPPRLRNRVTEMIRRANRNGGTDNITAVLISND